MGLNTLDYDSIDYYFFFLYISRLLPIKSCKIIVFTITYLITIFKSRFYCLTITIPQVFPRFVNFGFAMFLYPLVFEIYIH